MFENIKRNYENLINNDIPTDLRITSSRKIVEEIYDSFKGDTKIKQEFHDTNLAIRQSNEELKKQKRNDEIQRTYKDSVNGWLFFLTDKEYIPKSLKNSFDYVYKEASAWTHGEEGEQSAIKSIINCIKDIINWFFKNNNQDTDFINIEPDKIAIKQRKFKKTGIILFAITGILIVLYLVLSEIGNRVITPIEDALETTLVGEFDPDPAKKGTGFASINKGYVPDKGANLFDTITLSGLKSGEEFIFTVFTDFHNMGMINIEYAKVKLFVFKQEAKNKLIINSELSASNAPSINDIVTIEGVPNNYDVELIKLKKENLHGKTDPKECIGYNYEIDLDLEDANQGVNLDVLDSKYDGWCDQGYVTAVYKIIAR